MNVSEAFLRESLDRPVALNVLQSEKQKLDAQASVDELNAMIKAEGRRFSNTLGQDDFLRLLVAQLKHQDPLSPMQDKDFIAQMAQFSSLEQMTKVNTHMASLIRESSNGSSYQLLGKDIHWLNPLTGDIHEGRVTALTREAGLVKLSVGDVSIRLQDLVKVVQASDKLPSGNN